MPRRIEKVHKTCSGHFYQVFQVQPFMLEKQILHTVPLYQGIPLSRQAAMQALIMVQLWLYTLKGVTTIKMMWQVKLIRCYIQIYMKKSRGGWP